MCFASEYGINVAIHNHGQNISPHYGNPDQIDVLVVTDGHHFDPEPFFAIFEGSDDIKCVEHPLEDESEVFEDRGVVAIDFEHDTPALQEDMARNIAFIEEQARKLLARPGEPAHAGRR
ncbi:MAG: hypothetical protein KJ072_05710 [Verrucomicrobia bacterium]|nr:hypothetical protein [Verrucomicrobiota bacterium]